MKKQVLKPKSVDNINRLIQLNFQDFIDGARECNADLGGIYTIDLMDETKDIVYGEFTFKITGYDTEPLKINLYENKENPSQIIEN